MRWKRKEGESVKSGTTNLSPCAGLIEWSNTAAICEVLC